jgi:N-acetylglucosamine kinase-like BadF-type ATPase
VKVGGWGPFYGNEGSGEFVIREALRAAARDCDGRGPSTRLSEAICRSLQLKNFSESIAEIYREGVQWQKVAPLGAVVASVAQEGDEVAREIFQRAALDLVVALQAAARRLSLKPPVAISYQGSLFKAGEVLLDPLSFELKQGIPEAVLSPPLMSSVGGAYKLARKRLGKVMTPDECLEFGRRLEVFEKMNHQDTKAPSGL